ncbi:MAG: hypothetical protein WC527_08305 [Candidatus Margulisiibacteriota bacterium]
MNLKILNVVLAVVLVVLIGIWVFLIMNPREMHPPDIDKELGLGRDQIQKLNMIRDKTMSGHRLIFSKMQKLNEILNKELSKNTLDEAAILTIGKDIQVQHEKLAELRVSAIVESRKILGADKFAKMTDLFEKKRKEGPMGWRHGPGEPKGNRNKDGRDAGASPPPPEFGF